jgi:hypothetical protein
VKGEKTERIAGRRLSAGDAKADARRTPQNLVIPDLIRNPES